MLECACLFAARGDALLLVRIRDNDRWYLPGGKIEQGETPRQALCRELLEELSVGVPDGALDYRCTVEGPAYGRDGSVRLICFECRDPLSPQASNEVSEIAWLDRSSYDAFAPAVKLLYDGWTSGRL